MQKLIRSQLKYCLDPAAYRQARMVTIAFEAACVCAVVWICAWVAAVSRAFER